MNKKNILLTVASVGAIALFCSVFPDLKRYIRISTM